MENEEIDDLEHHQDFTTATAWEIFTATLEENIHDWKLSKTKPNAIKTFTNTSWSSESIHLSFMDIEFDLVHYFPKDETTKEREESETETDSSELFTSQTLKELFDGRNDFIPINDDSPALSLVSMYNISEFLVLIPTSDVVEEGVIKLILSSITIAINNTGLDLPFFVQCKQLWQLMYMGIAETRGLRTHFEMVHLKHGPKHFKYLNDFLEMFYKKINLSSLSVNVRISVRFTYSLPFANESFEKNARDGADEIQTLPFGTAMDPIKEIQLHTSWLNRTDSTAREREQASTLNPEKADRWSVNLSPTTSTLCLMGESLVEFIELSGDKSTLSDLLGDIVKAVSDNVNSALSRITTPRLSLSSVFQSSATDRFKRKNSMRIYDAPLSADMLMVILYWLFPDADENEKCPYPKFTDEVKSEVPDEFGNLKSCQFDTLTWRLAIVMVRATTELGGVRTFAQIWYEFVQELRFRLDRAFTIAGIPSSFPDSRTCLLNQKLQLLNCCIERRIKRESAQVDTNDDTSDEEFFDCDADEKDDAEDSPVTPVGRLEKFGKLKLIRTGEDLYIPVTQDPVPKTEDQLEQDADVLLQLGTDASASELRARMMSASLLSDMESFKAANPGAILDDFIRWYSPRDWIETDAIDEWGQARGHLSARMCIVGNTWVAVWDTAKPTPARRQKRLFDDTKEAEKVLHFFETRTIAQIVELLLPCVTHTAIWRLVNEARREQLPVLLDKINGVVRTCERVTRAGDVNLRHYDAIFREFSNLELSIQIARSLRAKLSTGDGALDDEQVEIFSGLTNNREMILPDAIHSSTGQKIVEILAELKKIRELLTSAEVDEKLEVTPKRVALFPDPVRKEYMIRARVARPSSHSPLSPQLLHVILGENGTDFRAAGAFTQDTLFF